ncbi:MAG: recombinase family protein, partial [Dehalococcoidia bacterium]
VVCWKSDRLSRGIYPAAALMEVMEAQQIRLESVTDTLDMKTFGIYAAVGKIEIDNFRERATLGKRGVAKMGKMPVGSLPYGYHIGDDGRPEIDPVEGAIIQRIFEEYVHRGTSVHVIARILTDEGAPLRKGSKWHAWQVAHIHRTLGREVYKGIGWYGRERHVVTEDGRKRFSQPKETWISLPYPVLVDDETWERAQKLKLERRNMAKRNTKSFYLLQHMLVCGECGMGFTARTANRNIVRRNERCYHYEYSSPRRYYKCQGMNSHGLKCREHPYLRADVVEGIVWSEVAKVLKHPDIILQGLQAQVEGHSVGGTVADLPKAERELRAIQAEEDRAIRLYVAGKITEAQFDTQRKFISERLEHAEAKVGSLKDLERSAQQKQSLAKGVLSWAKEVNTGLDALLPEERREVLRLVLDRVSIDRDGNIHITLAIPAPEFMSNASQGSSCWWQR